MTPSGEFRTVRPFWLKRRVVGDVDCGDDRTNPSRTFRQGQDDQGDRSRSGHFTEHGHQGPPSETPPPSHTRDTIPLLPRSPLAQTISKGFSQNKRRGPRERLKPAPYFQNRSARPRRAARLRRGAALLTPKATKGRPRRRPPPLCRSGPGKPKPTSSATATRWLTSTG